MAMPQLPESLDDRWPQWIHHSHISFPHLASQEKHTYILGDNAHTCAQPSLLARNTVKSKSTIAKDAVAISSGAELYLIYTAPHRSNDEAAIVCQGQAQSILRLLVALELPNSVEIAVRAGRFMRSDIPVVGV